MFRIGEARIRGNGTDVRSPRLPVLEGSVRKAYFPAITPAQAAVPECPVRGPIHLIELIEKRTGIVNHDVRAANLSVGRLISRDGVADGANTQSAF